MAQRPDLQSLLTEALAGFRRGDLARAESLCRQALKTAPRNPDLLHLLGVVLLGARRLDEALASLDQAVRLAPRSFEAFNNRGNALFEMKRYEQAVASYDKAVALKPDFANALNNRGAALRELRRFEEALASYDKAIALQPDYANAFSNRGVALMEMKRYDEALASYDKAIALKPDHAEAFNNRGIALAEMKRYGEALESYGRALALKPGHVDALNNRGNALKELKRYAEARDSFRAALQLRPDHSRAFGQLADIGAKICDWTGWPQTKEKLRAHLRAGGLIDPLIAVNFLDAPEDQLTCAKRYAADLVPAPLAPLHDGTRDAKGKIGVAYLSADFHEHATAYLMAELFEKHDRSRFEIVALSYGPDDGSPMRRRLEKAFDRFIDVRGEDDEQAARRLSGLGIGIAVDLKGYTSSARTRILAHRPAPVQVNYLGYPGTMGADFIDYVLVDSFVVPSDQQPHFTERLVHLPGCYQVNDRLRKIADQTPSRAGCGLPPEGFVFCCFNNNHKINPEIFDVWMRLLRAVPESALWLLGDSELAEANLRREAGQRGVDPGRLVFAPRLPLDGHLARHRLAGLFLDTLPYNAHTTASDALWAGLPVLTCAGKAFASRVAGSLLQATGLPELVVQSLMDYEALALKLARDPVLLSGLRARLDRSRLTAPLFDTGRFCRHIESAYAKMWEIYRSGEPPRPFAVDPIPGP